jgi:hypothetical protein
VVIYVAAHDAQRDAENAECVAKLCSALVMPNSVQRQKRHCIASFDFRCLSTLASRVAPGSVFGRSHLTIFCTHTHSAKRRFIKEGDVTLLASKFTPGKPLKKARSEGVCARPSLWW